MYVTRKYRVEFPVWGLDEAICFPTETDARYWARKWAAQDKMLVLVWSFNAAMYVGRYDGRV